MSAIIEFYNGTGTDTEGRTLDDILNFSLGVFESSHDYIQWLFPLRKPSNFNPDAPLLTDEDVAAFKQSWKDRSDLIYNYFNAVSKFLYFLGIHVWYLDAFDGFVLADNFETQKYTWLEFNHNALRITRLLTNLSILGWNKFAAELLGFLKDTAIERGVELSPNAIRYWEDALNGDDRKLS